MRVTLLFYTLLTAVSVFASDKQIIGPDDRIQIETFEESFHATVGMIEYEGRVNTYCTGTLITPRHVLTNGHCVVKNKETPAILLKPGEIRFTPGRLEDGGVPFGSRRARAIHTFDEWISTRQGQWDVAVVELEGDLIEPQIKLRPFRPRDLPSNVQLMISGYSAWKPYGTMWEGPGAFIRVLDNGQQFLHTIDTQPGTSGALVRYRSGDGWYIVGVHRGTAWPILDMNSGILFNDRVYNAVSEWIGR